MIPGTAAAVVVCACAGIAALPYPGESRTDRGVRHASALLAAGLVTIAWGLW